MERIFFTADLHLGHKNIMKYCDRDFGSVHEMNKELVRAWNDTVGAGDTIFFLGDLTMQQPKIPMYLEQLHGKKIYIIGNHDHKAEKIVRKYEKEQGKKIVEEFHTLTDRYLGATHVTMCHYAMRVWNGSHRGTIQVYGHSHGTLPPEGKSLDVGVDNAFRVLGEYRPFSLEEVVKLTSETGQEKVREIIYEYVRYIDSMGTTK